MATTKSKGKGKRKSGVIDVPFEERSRTPSSSELEPVGEPADEAAAEREPSDDDVADVEPPAELEPDPAELTDDLELASEHGIDAVRALAPVGKNRSIVRHDPLAAYMQEIRRYPLLTREEEHELAVKYAEGGDMVAARRLVTANLRLVVKIAHEYRRSYKNVLDLVQEGNLGLLQAVKKYDPHRGVKLSSYAAWWIRAYILKYVLNNWRLVKIGTTQAQRKLFFNLRKERDKLEREGYEVGPKLLAERLSVTEDEVNEMQVRLGSPDMSLDAPVGRDDESSRSPLDRLPSSAQTRPDRQVEGNEFRTLLRAKLETFAATLKGREETIFRERLLNDTPLTLQEIGEKYGISRERARQLEKRLVTRLRAYLEDELGEAVNIGVGEEQD